VQGPNYIADRATVQLLRDDAPVHVMHPEKRAYAGGGQVMTEAAIRPGAARDVYVALGEPLGGDAWAVRVHIKPFVRWIWAGALLMMLGGFVAAADRRFRVRAEARAGAPQPGAAGAAPGPQPAPPGAGPLAGEPYA
jgi:cytochrome c-type biogenesis protein CcmF